MNDCTITIDNIFCTIRGKYPAIKLDKVLSYMIPGAFMMPLYRLCSCKGKINPKTRKCNICGKPRRWDGKKHFFLGGKRIPHYFPTGCLSLVLKALRDDNTSYDIIDKRVSPFVADISLVDTLELIDPDDPSKIRKPWDHQKSAIKSSLKSQRGIIQIPTRGGKSSVMAGIFKLLPLKSAVFINNISIALQLQKEIGAMLGETVGLIGDGRFEPERITICMIQTLQSGLSLTKSKQKLPKDPQIVEWVESIQTMIHDEVHHIGDNIWYETTKMFKNAYYRFGVSGTVEMRSNGDDMLTMAATGKVIYEIPEQELIAKGLIARPIIHIYQIDKPYDIQIEDYTWQKAYDELIVKNNTYLNEPVANLIRELAESDNQILVMMERKEHIENFSKYLNGIDFEILSGEDDSDIREDIKDKFIKSKFKVLITTKIFDEGVTISNIDWVFRLGMMMTPIKTKQQVGRGQANKKDKPNIVHIGDFALTMNPHLRKHSFERFKVYRDLGYEVILEKGLIK